MTLTIETDCIEHARELWFVLKEAAADCRADELPGMGQMLDAMAAQVKAQMKETHDHTHAG